MSLEEWFALYSVSHKNPTNKKIHYFCVPLIYFSIAGLLFPYLILPNIPELNLAGLAMILSLLFYFRLNRVLGLFMLFINASIYFALIHWATWCPFDMLTTNLSIFILAWIGQFIGHKIEGKKPSFFEDLKFLLIGPAWVAVQLIPMRTK